MSQLNHHWPQYGMKTLILGLTVTCLFVGMLSGRLRQAHEQRQLIAGIGRLGGTVGYDMRTRGEHQQSCRGTPGR